MHYKKESVSGKHINLEAFDKTFAVIKTFHTPRNPQQQHFVHGKHLHRAAAIVAWIVNLQKALYKSVTDV